MIAVTLTLVIVGVMVRAFKSTGDEIGIGRARLDMHTQLRMVTETLRRDLQNATCLPRVRGLNDEESGYFEYVEGPEFDLEHVDPTSDSFIGDHDDVLALTVRSEGRPFRGRYNGGFVESYLAEVIWFVVHEGADGYEGNFRLYRRVLLIRPDLAANAAAPADFFEANDISARPEGGNMVSNTLEDLADRANRYAHDRSTFPYELQTGVTPQAPWLEQRVLGIDGGDGVFDSTLEGQDLMLAGCVGFDIKVFSPDVPSFVPAISNGPLQSSPPYLPATFTDIEQTIEFNDPGFDDLYSAYPATTYSGITGFPPMYVTSYPQTGGFVDLGVNPYTPQDPPLMDVPRPFQGAGSDAKFIGSSYPMESFPPSIRPYRWIANTWCSWYGGFDSDGFDNDGDGLIDEGANGIDDNGVNGVDDTAERESQPPYPYPIRSIQISVRMVEKKTNQVLQKTIKESFVPN